MMIRTISTKVVIWTKRMTMNIQMRRMKNWNYLSAKSSSNLVAVARLLHKNNLNSGSGRTDVDVDVDGRRRRRSTQLIGGNRYRATG